MVIMIMIMRNEYECEFEEKQGFCNFYVLLKEKKINKFENCYANAINKKML